MRTGTGADRITDRRRRRPDRVRRRRGHTLAVCVYEVDPFIDGNARATWHLRNYALMLDGLPSLDDPSDPNRCDTAWWAATTTDHEALDDAVLAELNIQKFT